MIVEIPICACGQPMVPTREGSDVFKCENCDTVQSTEAREGRKPTIWDRAFERTWEERKKGIYAQ